MACMMLEDLLGVEYPVATYHLLSVMPYVGMEGDCPYGKALGRTCLFGGPC